MCFFGELLAAQRAASCVFHSHAPWPLKSAFQPPPSTRRDALDSNSSLLTMPYRRIASSLQSANN
jgi:hypothetical protein